MRILPRRTLERRLFSWLLGLALVPALLVLGAAAWLGRGAVDWLGSLGPWTEITATGTALINATRAASGSDPQLDAAADRHRAELERSLTQARRWRYLGERLTGVLPIAILAFALALAGVALLISRKLARELSRPFQELAAWTEQIARAEPLPPPAPAEAREVREVQALRQSLRKAAADLASARERELQQERTRAWGELARRLAHEMKNPLTPLRLAVHRLRSVNTAGATIGEVTHVIEEETARLEHLAREFGMLGRPAEGPRSAVDLGELLRVLIATDLPPSVRAGVQIEGAQPAVTADYNALHQAFRNVLRNSVEAMQATPNPTIQVMIAANESGTTVTIADNGPGFTPASMTDVFEPDFTTKPRGTGLGLTITRQIIESHGGTVQAGQSLLGGAAVTIRLPAHGAQT